MVKLHFLHVTYCCLSSADSRPAFTVLKVSCCKENEDNSLIELPQKF